MIFKQRHLEERFYDIQESVNGLTDKNIASYAELDLLKFNDVLSAEKVAVLAKLTLPVAPVLRMDRNSIYYPPLKIGNVDEYIQIDRSSGTLSFYTS